MALIEITEQNLSEHLSKNSTLILDFWASWCGPCRSFAPVFEAAATRYPDIDFGKVNTEAQQRLAAEFGIQAIPTLMVFREKVLLFQQPGALTGPQLDGLIGQVMALDMAKVHAEVAAHAHDHSHDGDHGHSHDH